MYICKKALLGYEITIQLSGFINNIMLYNPDGSNVTCSEKKSLNIKNTTQTYY